MSKNYAALARSVVTALGGVDNITAVTHCMTRLRFVIKDDSQVDSATLKTLTGVLGVVRNENQCQVIIGNTVSQAYREVVCLLPANMQPAEPQTKPRLTLKRIGAGILDALIGTMSPLIPAIIMISTTIANIWLVKGTQAWEVVNFLGSSPIAMFIAMVVAFVLFGTARGHDMQWVMNAFENAVKSIAMVILIIGAGGVLKQTIIDTGIGDTIGMLMSHGNISPYIMAWLITVLIRLATGQGVVSAMTAAGIISAAILDPATGQLVGVDPALLVLATAAGSNTLTHINDASFWLFKGYFDLSVKDTLKTWGLLELVNSVVGLIIVLIISMIA